MKVIALDVMGTDLGVEPALQASAQFLKTHPDVKIIFVGQSVAINKVLQTIAIPANQYAVQEAGEVIEQTDGIMAIRRKQDSSMVRALELVAANEADAVVSGGSTAAFLSGCHFILGEIDNIERPAFMPFIPTIVKNQPVLMLDVGANLENTAQDLHKFAQMANIYAQSIMQIPTPRIALLNIGQEPTKGKDYHKQAYKLLENDDNLNFIGNIEPREITSGTTDIIVTDGYTGNVALKAIEGMAKNLMAVLKAELTRTLWTKIKALLLRKAFVGVKETFNYKNYAAALVLGLKKLAVKTHGSSDVKSYLSTLAITYAAINNEIVDHITHNFTSQNSEVSVDEKSQAQ